VFAEGQAMLKKLIDGRWLTANGVILLPANSVNDDDIEIYTDDARSSVASPTTACASRPSSPWSMACSVRTSAWPTSSRRRHRA
jgi:cobalamin-dependent methionine synthase I